MKTVLVTGATGALGQAVIAYLHNTGNYQVIATSRHGDDENIFSLDVSNAKQFSAVINRTKPDLLMHLAATFVNDFDEAYAVNVDATRHLLNTVQKSGLAMRILLVGSAAEYGAIRPKENPIREDHALNPVSIYGLSKAWQTQLAGLYASQGMDVVVARVFNLNGKGLSERLFIGRLQKQIDEVLAGRKSVIELGPLSATRDYLTLDEAVEQIVAIAEYAVAGRVYHVASGVPITMRELLNHYLTLNQLDASIVQESAALTNRSGYDVPVIYADVTNTMQLMQLEKEALCQS
ncbi:MAG: NAD-dependent epimerase/dehydratase family protein [Methylococcales bacterium]|nr:NAD-dependent epimerase/dehydratase family protein [Methylococcales bacterium]